MKKDVVSTGVKNNLPRTPPALGAAERGRGASISYQSSRVTLLGEGEGQKALTPAPSREPPSDEKGPLSPHQRSNQAFQVRHKASLYQRRVPLPGHPTNGDDDAYAQHIASYSKGLPHNALGEVDPEAYARLIAALSTGRSEHFEAVPLGGVHKLCNPQAAYAYALEGPDSHHLGMTVPPTFSSAETAAEMVELYWQALCRDVPYAAFPVDDRVGQACTELMACSQYRGPRQNGQVTPACLFRGNTPSDLAGPPISQFLWQDVPQGVLQVVQKARFPVVGQDHLTAYEEWLAVQQGALPAGVTTTEEVPRHIRCGRDLAEYVLRDHPFQAFLNAALLLVSLGEAAFSSANPYHGWRTQRGELTFGPCNVLDVVVRVASVAMKAAWYQKWLVHRRLRPEAMGGRIHLHMTGRTRYPLHPDVLHAGVLTRVYDRQGTYLLSQAAPGGAPLHPAYPSGHAAVAGACATVLKAFFKEAYVLPASVVASEDGQLLLPYEGAPLTVGGELHKLASNIALAGVAAGTGFRSDAMEGMRLGEAVAIGFLRDLRGTYHEHFSGFTLTRLDGVEVNIR
ncbi:MAG: vanadium-dependent haloperoxidase [Myxococcota bacterium]